MISLIFILLTMLIFGLVINYGFPELGFNGRWCPNCQKRVKTYLGSTYGGIWNDTHCKECKRNLSWW